jgi:hypothetical protein
LKLLAYSKYFEVARPEYFGRNAKYGELSARAAVLILDETGVPMFKSIRTAFGTTCAPVITAIVVASFAGALLTLARIREASRRRSSLINDGMAW